MLTIKEVKTSRELKRFIRFPYRLYRAFPMWVPPLMVQIKDTLNPKKNPFFGHAAVQHFVAQKNGRTAGRITAIVDDNYIRFQQEKAGFFGYYETIYDKEVSNRLLAAAETYLRNQGMKVMRGPINLTTNNECGLLIKGFELPPVIMMPYNPPYYQELLDDYGLQKGMDLYAYLMREQDVGERIRRYMELIRLPEGYTIRPINMKRLHQEIQKVKIIYNQAWEKNWGFVPVSYTHLRAHET